MPFVPANFAIPQGFRTADFILRPLTIHDLIKDYDAVMSSRERLVGVFGPGADWPAADMTLEEDLVDLGWHQGEFDRRRSFAYTVMAPQAGGAPRRGPVHRLSRLDRRRLAVRRRRLSRPRHLLGRLGRYLITRPWPVGNSRTR